jgi:YesN/AraC family two-component response regulator
MRALLIDNESNIRHGLHDLLHAFCPEITAIHEADSVINGINAIALYSHLTSYSSMLNLTTEPDSIC